ncbi:MAG: photosystem II assembly protein Psb34 [Vulcanococcus sp.]
MQVTEEDGGRLNAFAREPRMQVMEADEARSGANKVLLIGGAVLVLLLVAVAAGIS